MAAPPRPPGTAAAVPANREEENLTLLVVAGVHSLSRVQELVASFVSEPGRVAASPDLILALGPFALEGEEEEGVEEDATPLPPWMATPLDRGTVEGRAAAGGWISGVPSMALSNRLNQPVELRWRSINPSIDRRINQLIDRSISPAIP
jgi:hypothetical protein